MDKVRTAEEHIWYANQAAGNAVALIGSITFVFSAAGIRLGNVFGLHYKRKAEFAGGVILILLGTKILLEHLGVL